MTGLPPVSGLLPSELRSDDESISIGDGYESADDPVLHGGSLRIVSGSDPGFDDTYELPASTSGTTDQNKTATTPQSTFTIQQTQS